MYKAAGNHLISNFLIHMVIQTKKSLDVKNLSSKGERV